MLIRTKPGVWIASVDTPQAGRLSTSIIADAVAHCESNDCILEFVYHGEHWTIDSEDVEYIDLKGAVLCLN
jgi:hypothetical protein